MQAASSVDAAVELVRELKALEQSGSALATFDERRVREVIAVICRLEGDTAAALGEATPDLRNPYYAALPAYQRAKALRLKRCLLTYLQWRLDSVSSLWWESRDQAAVPRLTAPEQEYLRQYNGALVDYMTGAFPTPLDLRGFYCRPPCSTPSGTVEVRGLRDVTFTSPVSLRVLSVYPGKVCAISVEDAEGLVQQGIAEYVV